MTGTSADGEARIIRWGVLGAGGIATSFCSDLALLPEHQVVAVGARRPGTNTEFADRLNIPNRYDSYAGVVNDPEIGRAHV